jgi:phosphate starvation-inducible PhoH-like protein
LSTGQRQLSIEGLNPAEIYGINNANLKHIKSFFPKLKVIARGNELSLAGDDEIMDEFERKFALILQHFHTYNALSENNIDNLMLQDGAKLLSTDDGSETLVHGNGGVKIKARTVNQKNWSRRYWLQIWFLQWARQAPVKPIQLLPWQSGL